MSDTLILNKDGMPLSMLPLSAINWQIAIKLLVCDKIYVLKDHEDWIVRSPSTEYKVPSVAIVKDYVKYNRVIKYNRSNVFLRDRYTCQLCGKKPGISELTLDHVIPSSHGGKTKWTNIVAACRKCNESKGDNINIRPKKKPMRPSYYQMVAERQKYPIRIRDEYWLSFLDWPKELVHLHEP